MPKIKHILISLGITYVFISLGFTFYILEHYVEISNIVFVILGVLILRFDPSGRYGDKKIKAFMQSIIVGYMVTFHLLVYELITSGDIKLGFVYVLLGVLSYLLVSDALNNS